MNISNLIKVLVVAPIELIIILHRSLIVLCLMKFMFSFVPGVA